MHGRFRSFVLVALVLGGTAACAGGDDAESPTTRPPDTTVAPTTASPTTTTLPPVPAQTASAAELCGNALPDSVAPEVASVLLVETSGIAASRRHPGLIWAHNDSGGLPQLFLIGPDGADLGAFDLTDAGALDWEDMDIGPGPGGVDHLYVGDIGDNFEIRSTVNVYRAAEPTDVSTPAPIDADRLTFSYPDGAHDAEALLVDPISGRIHIVTKFTDGTPSSVYRAPADVEPGQETELERLGAVDLSGVVSRTEPAVDDPELGRAITAATIASSGTVIGVRTYNDVVLWQREPGESVFDAMSRPPCVPRLIRAKQGEALSFTADGRGFVTISEGENRGINRVALPN